MQLFLFPHPPDHEVPETSGHGKSPCQIRHVPL